jgi:type I restriction enzyme M protein
VFIGPAVRGEEGQFFTPRNVVKLMIDVIDPSPGELIVDPACGSGGFLIVVLEHVWKKIEHEAKQKNWSETLLEGRRRQVATRCFRGLDKDAFLTKITKAYMAIVGDGRGGVFCEDSLAQPGNWHAEARQKIPLDTFDVVITNPPGGLRSRSPVHRSWLSTTWQEGGKPHEIRTSIGRPREVTKQNNLHKSYLSSAVYRC